MRTAAWATWFCMIFNNNANLLDWRRLEKASKSNFGVVWPRPLTSWPPKLTISSPCPLDHLWKFSAKSVHSFSKYRVHKANWRTDERMDGRTDRPVRNIMPPPVSLSTSLNWQRRRNYTQFSHTSRNGQCAHATNMQVCCMSCPILFRSSSAIAERPASCLSVVSFNSTIPRAQSYKVTSASDSPLRTINSDLPIIPVHW